METTKIVGYVVMGFALILLITLFFVKANVDEQAAYLCELTHSDPNLDISQCPAHSSNTSWLLTIAIAVGAVTLGIGAYLSFVAGTRKQIEGKTEFKHVDTSSLDEDEKTVYGILKQSDGSVYQSDIVKQTEFSKVKTTRILDKLESRGIIDRKRRGMTNIIVLK
jgi:uncharacterized membrane protein